MWARPSGPEVRAGRSHARLQAVREVIFRFDGTGLRHAFCDRKSWQDNWYRARHRGMASDPDGTCRRRPSRSGLRLRRFRPRARRRRAQPQGRRPPIPRDALVVFTGVSGSGKSSLAFGTLYAEAQRRYLESVSPYARRLFHQLGVPEVDEIDGLPPAVALQQQRGSPSARSSVGSVTTLSNLLRMLYSRAGEYPPGQGILYAESFSPNTPEGACPECHGLGRVYEVTERSMVPDDSLTIRQRAVAAWPTAWQGQNLREILMTLGVDVDTPWRDLPKKDRDWILFTDEQPTVPVYSGYTADEVKEALKRKEAPSYMGTFTSARRHVLNSFANSQSALMRKRALQFMIGQPTAPCAAASGSAARRWR